MKVLRYISLVIGLMVSMIASSASAQSSYIYGRNYISGVNLEKKGDKLIVFFEVDPKAGHLSTNRKIVFNPVIKAVESNDSIVLPTVSVAGRNMYYYAERSEMPQDSYLLRSGKDGKLRYEKIIDWQDWMVYSKFYLLDETAGCCGASVLPVENEPVANLDFRPRQFNANFDVTPPVATDVKTRALSGSAFINFPVNRTEIYPDYMVNPFELRKILNTIDTVRFDPDATVKRIELKGFASPEGPYQNNVRLAKGRTEALKEYVRKQYTFPAEVFATDYEPEDWAGLRKAVLETALDDRDAIIDFIDNGNVPIERRNDEFRKRFPRSYAWLLANVYPSLRHTEYVISYDLRQYTDVNEIIQIMKTRPQNLSINEFYLAALHYGLGTPEADEVFSIAVSIYPVDEVANLHAASIAARRGDYVRANAYLLKAGVSTDAEMLRGTVAALEGEFDKAEQYFLKVRQMGDKRADTALSNLKIVKENNNPITYVKK